MGTYNHGVSIKSNGGDENRDDRSPIFGSIDVKLIGWELRCNVKVSGFVII